MKRLTILCDADDTIENLSAHWIEELNKTYNKNVCREDIRDWDMTKAYPDLKEEEVLAPLYRDDFWEKITPIEESGYYLEKLIKDGHNLYIVTASNIETKNAKIKKLLSLFPFFNPDKIIFTENKQSVSGDILIDDGVHNLINGKYKKFLFNQPNNKDFEAEKYGIIRVFGWKDIYEKIYSICA